jgi:dTDP-4-amino-4,6-dideoxygalactose transaminase
MEGGCVATDDDHIAMKARRIAHFGLWPSGMAQVVGLNAHMLEVSALVGLAALPELDAALAVRRRVASRYFFGLREFVDFPAVLDVSWPTWCYFPILLADAAKRDHVRFSLERAGVEARPYYVECHTMPAYKSQTPLPATEGLSRRVLALPVYSDQSDEEAAYVIDAVKEAVL